MNEEEHIDENIQVACDKLANGMSEEELAIVKEVRDTYGRLSQIGCTGCAYCMPCPAGIDIPAAFKSLNNYHMFGKMEATMYHVAYAGIQTEDGKPHWTSACIDCGKCEKACPYSYLLVRLLDKFKKTFKSP